MSILNWPSLMVLLVLLAIAGWWAVGLWRDWPADDETWHD
jgi:hypothetical protein